MGNWKKGKELCNIIELLWKFKTVVFSDGCPSRVRAAVQTDRPLSEVTLLCECQLLWQGCYNIRLAQGMSCHTVSDCVLV